MRSANTSLVALTIVMVSQAPAPARAAWSTRQLAGTSVRVYTPLAHSPSGAGRALLVALHGCIQTNADLEQEAGFEDTAERWGVVVALPAVPDGGVYLGCWDYYGADHTRSTRHNRALLSLTRALRDDAGLEIDAAQIYLAGFSSGGGQAMITGCLAPELFAGVALAAAPSAGTSAFEPGSVATTAEDVAAVCAALAGAHDDAFATQLVALIAGDDDDTVDPEYAWVNAEAYASLLAAGGSFSSEVIDVAALPGYAPQGNGTLYVDEGGARLMRIGAEGLAHAWPSGLGEDGNPAGSMSVDFAEVLASFFAENNRRVVVTPDEDGGPVDDGAPETDDDGSSAGDADEYVMGDSTTTADADEPASTAGVRRPAKAVSCAAVPSTMATLLALLALRRRGRRPAR